MHANNALHRWGAAPLTLALAGTAHAQSVPQPEHASFGGGLGGDGHASICLGLGAGRSMFGARDLRGQVIVTIPFGRWVAAAPAAPGAQPAEPPEPPPPRVERPRQAIAVKPALARECVRAAWRAHGLSNLDKTDEMRSRARTSALLPEARLRVARDWDQSYRLTPTTDDPYRLQESNGGGRTVEARLTWKLDRLLFVDQELSLERLHLQRVQLRNRLAGEVLHALFDWQRARMAAADVGLDDAEHLEAVVRSAEAEAMLDVLTGGWFSSWLDAGSVRKPRRSAP